MPMWRASISRYRPIKAPRRPSAAPSPATRGWPWPTWRWRARCRCSTSPTRPRPSRCRRASWLEPAASRTQPRQCARHRDRRRQCRRLGRRQGAPRRLSARCHGAGALHGRVRPDRLLGPSGPGGRAVGAARAACRCLRRGLVVHSALAFAQVEVGDIDRAEATIERSLALYPRNAHGAHIRGHVYYEAGERAAGLAYLEDWWQDYPRESMLHCHISWHIALWQLALGRPRRRGASTARTCAQASPPGRRSTRCPTRPPSCCARRWRARRATPSCGASSANTRRSGSPRRHRLRRRARSAGARVRGRRRGLAGIVERAKGPARDVVAPIAQRLRRLQPLGLGRGRGAAARRARPRTSASAAAAPSAT